MSSGMKVGFIGAGNMAAALARGFGDPVFVSDPASERSEALVGQVGGEALATNLEVAQAADVVIICHKPAQLAEVALEIDGTAACVVSVLGSVTVDEVRAAYKQSPAFRVLPNLPVEVGKGVLCWPLENGAREPAQRLRKLFARVGRVVELDEELMEVAMTMSSNAPAFVAFAMESLMNAGVRNGLTVETARLLVLETLVGTGALLEERGGDFVELRESVTSPGGSTARGIAALEAAGVRDAFQDAVRAVLDPPPS